MANQKKAWKRDTQAEKKKIGKRFKEFRFGIKRTQLELANELNVYQSTITNIEVGKTFPCMKYLIYIQDTYNLNINWLLNNIDRPFIPIPAKKFRRKSYILSNLESTDPRLEKYQELIDLMGIPDIELIIFGKLTEIKLIAKEEIEDYLIKTHDGEPEPGNPLDHGKVSEKGEKDAQEKEVS